MNKYLRSFLLCVTGLPALGCGVGPDPEPSTEGPASEAGSAVSTAVFSGMVTNNLGAPIAGATVLINGVTRTTDGAGKYAMSVVRSDSGYAISITRLGYAPAAEFSSEGKLNAVHKLKGAFVKLINPTINNTVASNTGVVVKLKASSLATMNGAPVTAPVNISIATYEPLGMPGDYTAVTKAGKQVAIESVGAISVSATLAATGAPLRLKPMATAEAFIPVPPAVGTMPPCVSQGACRLAMWRFDTATGRWLERSANMQVNTLGTSFTMGGDSAVNTDNGLGIWNVDIEKSSPGCTIVELSNIPKVCYNPMGASPEPGITLKLKLPNSANTLIDSARTVNSGTPFVAVYNLRANVVEEVGIAFPPGAPAHCADLLNISSDPPPSAGYPVYTAIGGATRLNSGAPWGGTGFPTEPGTNSLITFDDVVNDDHPCGSYVLFAELVP